MAHRAREMMTKSQLCQRIELCGHLQALNKDGCCEAIRLLCDILCSNNLNRLLTATISNPSILSYNDLRKFDKKFHQLLSSNSQYIQQEQQSSTSTIDRLLEQWS